MLRTYHLDHAESGESQVLDGWSYFWGALAGPVYVFVKGFRLLALAMLGISCAIIIVAFLALSFAVTIFDDPLLSVLAIVGTVIVAIAMQSSVAVELVRYGLVRRGWREGYY
ncbi:MAG TPA: hypothetical protein VFB13_07225 [Reyranella sp.]|nr:hypothetical protein [Reyranella sp.]